MKHKPNKLFVNVFNDAVLQLSLNFFAVSRTGSGVPEIGNIIRVSVEEEQGIYATGC